MLYHRRSLLALQVWLRYGLLEFKPFMSLRDAVYHHVESIGTKSYSLREMKRLFRQYKDVTITPVLTTYDTQPFPASCTNYLPQAWGWFLVAQGVK
jgi:hypothetical protein